jgi:peptidoglycan/xylan/chitin deacetylase (PgdA/CDA1 family)
MPAVPSLLRIDSHEFERKHIAADIELARPVSIKFPRNYFEVNNLLTGGFDVKRNSILALTNPGAYEQALKDEFDQLYEEGSARRRMMVISLHDRISGHAGRVRVLDRFLTYAKSKPGAWFARKDEIADWALKARQHTPVLDRGPVGISGLSGPAA